MPGLFAFLFFIVLLAVLIAALNDKLNESNSLGSRPFKGAWNPDELVGKLRPRNGDESVSAQLDRLKKSDPNFSAPVFDSFVGLLFVRYHQARAIKRPQSVAGYVSSQMLEKLSSEPHLTSVIDIVVGSQKITAIRQSGNQTEVTVNFTACYTEISEAGSKPIYAEERWTFSRETGVVSSMPEQILRLSCPCCGQTRELKPDGTCFSCQSVVNRGQFNWILIARQILSHQDKPTIDISNDTEEGLERPTVYDPRYYPELRAHKGRHPDFDWDAFGSRVRNIFVNLQNAWSSQDFDKARPYEMDVLYDSHRYWIDRYKAEGLTNHLADISVSKIEACKIVRDAFYESITVRIFAQMRDWTTDRSGALVAGNPKKIRKFSEYWTFIRRIGSDAPIQPDLSLCPSCGAPLDHINQSGVCHYCQSQIASGNFDWVLNSIEQDEVYGQ